MTENEFQRLFGQIMRKLDDTNPDGHIQILRTIAKENPALLSCLEDITSTIYAVRMVLKYMALDMEATKREKEELLMTLQMEWNKGKEN